MTQPRAEPLFALARLSRYVVVLLVSVPVLAGLAGTILPAIGYFPALGETGLSLDPFRSLFAEPGIGKAIWLSLKTGFVATILSVALSGLIVAAGFGTPGWTRLTRVLSPILSVPHAAAAFGLAFLIAPSGFLSRLVSPWPTGWENPPDFIVPNDPAGLTLIAGLVVKEVPFLLLLLIAALNQSDAARSLHMARALGYGRMAAFAFSLWPRLYRQIRVMVFAVLAFSASVVDVSLILGPTTPGTLVTFLIRWMNDPDLNLRLPASAGALLQLALVLFLFAVWVLVERVGRLILEAFVQRGSRFERDRMLMVIGNVSGWLIAFTVLSGISLLGIWSLSGLWSLPGCASAGFNRQGLDGYIAFHSKLRW